MRLSVLCVLVCSALLLPVPVSADEGGGGGGEIDILPRGAMAGLEFSVGEPFYDPSQDGICRWVAIHGKLYGAPIVPQPVLSQGGEGFSFCVDIVLAGMEPLEGATFRLCVSAQPEFWEDEIPDDDVCGWVTGKHPINGNGRGIGTL